ncbi:MAG: glycine cleavage system protein H [Candidatus Acidiferrales bacterium]|jgi:glycine cleavage system H lipoate-binding protein
MTIAIVLVMFAAFFAVDYFRNAKRAKAPAVAEPQAVIAIPKLNAAYVSGFEIRENRRYHPGHTWALAESPTIARVGMDDFAARLVGHADELQLPKRGQWIRQGQKFATLMKQGRKADLVSPIEGEITDVNEAALRDALLPGRDPYGEGWLITVMSPDMKINFRNLLNGTVARGWMKDAADRLRQRIPAMATADAMAQDGGVALPDLSDQIPKEKWDEVAHEFFLA